MLCTVYRSRALLAGALLFAPGLWCATRSPVRADVPGPDGLLWHRARSGRLSAPLLINPAERSGTRSEADLEELLLPGVFENPPPREEAPLRGAARLTGPGSADPPPPGKITVSDFRRITWSSDGRTLHVEGVTAPATRLAQITFSPLDGSKPTVIKAGKIDYDSRSGVIRASEGVRLERAEGRFTGQEVEYNYQKRSGVVKEGVLETELFRARGAQIALMENREYVVDNGIFTTCLRDRPDYRIKARQIRISANGTVSARHVTFYAGNTALLTVPSYRRNLSSNGDTPLPVPGYSRKLGPFIRFRDRPIAEREETFDYDIRVNFRALPMGFIAFQHDLLRTSADERPPTGLLQELENPLQGFLERLSAPTYREYAESTYRLDHPSRTLFFAILQHRQFVYNRHFGNLSVSRFPSIGVRWLNLLGHAPAAAAAVPSRPGSLLRQPGREDEQSSLAGRAPMLLDVAASASMLNEEPTNTTTGRLAFRANLASPPVRIGGRISLRLGITNWTNLYTQGTLYSLLSPEIELDYTPTRSSVVGAAYRYLTDIGKTPLISDRRDVRHELRLKYQVGGPWAFGIATAYDLERLRAYESELAIFRNLDCLQIGLAYRRSTQSLTLLFNLLPPARHLQTRSAP